MPLSAPRCAGSAEGTGHSLGIKECRGEVASPLQVLTTPGNKCLESELFL